MKRKVKRLFLISILIFMQSGALNQVPSSAQGPTTSKTSALDKWISDGDSTNFSQVAAQGSIDGVPFKARGATFEKNQVANGYYLVISDAATPPNQIRFGIAQLPSHYYGKTIIHHLDNFNDPDITMKTA